MKRFLGGKKYFTKIKRAEVLFFVYNYYLTKPYKCAIINLDPPLGGRHSRNSHYTTSFKKSQIKSHRQTAQSFFPKLHSFCATCTTLTILRVASPDTTPICDPFCLAARARAHMPAVPAESWPLKNFFYPLGDRRVALIFPYGRDIATNLDCCQQKFFFSLL